MRIDVGNDTNIFFRCVEDSREAIMICDREGRLAYVNPAWESIYGYKREEAIGKTPRLLHSGLQDPGFYTEMWRAIRDPARGFWRGELVNRARDGKLVPVLLTITPFRSRTGEIEGYMGIALDVTRERDLEERLVRQERLAAMGILASGLAHEVGTPLGVIRGRAELVARRCSELPEAAQNAELIVAEADRIARLIQSLLKLGRPSGPVSQAVPVRETVAEILALFEQVFRDHGITALVDVAADSVAQADPVALQQVLLNLLANAVHAIEEEAARNPGRKPGSIAVRAMRAGGTIRVEVEDNGCGISPEIQDKIFEPFFTTKDIGKGTGMGLAIVSKLVAEMGGDIRVHSRAGKGALFSITLPASVREEARP